MFTEYAGFFGTVNYSVQSRNYPFQRKMCWSFNATTIFCNETMSFSREES